MPVLEVWKAKNVIVSSAPWRRLTRGVDNPLFYKESTRSLFGERKNAGRILSAPAGLGDGHNRHRDNRSSYVGKPRGRFVRDLPHGPVSATRRFAAVKLFEDAGCKRRSASAQTCCGQPALNSVTLPTRDIARQVIETFVATTTCRPSGSCMATTKRLSATLCGGGSRSSMTRRRVETACSGWARWKVCPKCTG